MWRQTMLQEMKMELSLHPGAKFIYKDADGDNNRQIEQVNEMLKEGVDILIISPNEAEPLTPVVEKVYNSGIPVVVLDRKTSTQQYTAYVGADNYQVGKIAGEYIASLSDSPIDLAEITGLAGSSPAMERERGFMDGIAGKANVKLKVKVHGNWLRSVAISQLDKVKDQLKDVNYIFAHNDVMAAGARAFLNQLAPHRPIKIVGVDALPGQGGGLQMVSDGVLNASLLYPTGGKEAIETAFHILNNEPFNKLNIMQSLAIDSANVQLMKLQWNRINSQQHDIESQRSLLQEQRIVYNNQKIIMNIIVITLVLAIVFGGLAFFSLIENRKANRSLEAKNQEILAQRNQLVEMSAKADAANEAKFNFFTNISHEFRTPLTLILSPLDEMLKDDGKHGSENRSLKVIQQNAFRLLGLVNQLLDYRKLEYDNQKVKVSENDIVGFARKITDSFRHHAQKLNVNMIVTNEAKVIKSWFDPLMLDKVFFNLIANALKFSNQKGTVRINIRKDQDKAVLIEVQDNGLGMSREDAEQVFDQFYQADHAPILGSGIGLTLTKQIVTLHHGTIEVKSEKWRGSTFTVSLPLGHAHFSDSQLLHQTPVLPDVAERSRTYTADLDQLPDVAKGDVLSKPKEYSVLIVEDNPDLLHYLEEKLSEHFEIYKAANGISALQSAIERVPDLIISDVVLPELSGKGLCERLKSDFRTSHIPVILLTAQNSLEQQISGIHAMADAYLTKPFDIGYLLATMQGLIKNRMKLKERFTSDNESSEKAPIAKTLDHKFVNDFLGIVEQNLGNENFDVEEICSLLSISRVQLYRKVKALLGCSVADYILNRRLKRAKYLLTNSNKSIAEITYEIGFSNPNYFSTVFKSKYNSTPSEFRRQHLISS
ncbi:substrate-binding domain-containing protein [Mucilaginibacter daejeonensis]|nr:substrate-binding domain-containing protein [Mucilaginibacter daejeonensis]UEG51346.1 substrate-binding domain-containing protein [Mucilaginibacter daejeonensis]